MKFDYYPIPEISRWYEPTSGPSSGHSTVIIHGNGFDVKDKKTGKRRPLFIKFNERGTNRFIGYGHIENYNNFKIEMSTPPSNVGSNANMYLSYNQ